MHKQRIVVGLSGGVDSAVTAHLLKQQGHEVIGIFMKNWEDDDDSAFCSSNIDFVDAAAVADVIGIQIEHVNFAADYKDRVFAEFLREYQAGRTPNPDILCNAEIKFKAFLDHAMRLGAEKIATGHYARVRRVAAPSGSMPFGHIDESHATARDSARVRRVAPPSGSMPFGHIDESHATARDSAGVRRVAAPSGSMSFGHIDESHATARDSARPFDGHYQLLKGLDPAKDQSYFLHRLNQAQLSRTLFPVGELHKTEVRRIADEIGLPNAKKKDSTGICFIGERPFREFLNRYIAKAPGPIKNDKGRVLGEHVGLSFYTLGQRQGLGIGGVKARGAALKAVQALGQRGLGEHAPWFVARKDMADNTLWVVQGHDHPWLQSTLLQAQDCSWVAGMPPAAGTVAAKTRYRQADAACELTEPSATHAELRFEQPQWAVTPGQSAVLYQGEVCLGGGVIASSNVQNLP